MNDDKITQAAQQLATDVTPERDLWSGIAAAIEAPERRRWTPMLAQAAVVLLLVGASSAITYMALKDSNSTQVIASPEMVFEQVSFGNRHKLGPAFQAVRDELAGDFELELLRLSPQTRQDIETDMGSIHAAINEMNNALEGDPENILLQKQLLRMYREELALLQRVSGLSRSVMMRNDI